VARLPSIPCCNSSQAEKNESIKGFLARRQGYVGGLPGVAGQKIGDRRVHRTPVVPASLVGHEFPRGEPDYNAEDGVTQSLEIECAGLKKIVRFESGIYETLKVSHPTEQKREARSRKDFHYRG
jgi:hypothetical protein